MMKIVKLNSRGKTLGVGKGTSQFILVLISASRFQEWSGRFYKQNPFQESSLSTTATSARTQLL